MSEIQAGWAKRPEQAFAELLAAEGVLVMPGAVFEWPGHFRLSLTASDAMIDRALPGFAAAIARVGARQPDVAGVLA